MSGERIAVVGSRDGIKLPDVREVMEALHRRNPDATIVSGGARGVDRWAVEEAVRLGMDFDVLRADWATGKLAGKERNWRLAASGIDGLVALWDGWSNGTAHAVTAATHLGVRCGVYCRPPVFIQPVAEEAGSLQEGGG